jgi:hypothetical protein
VSALDLGALGVVLLVTGSVSLIGAMELAFAWPAETRFGQIYTPYCRIVYSVFLVAALGRWPGIGST